MGRDDSTVNRDPKMVNILALSLILGVVLVSNMVLVEQRTTEIGTLGSVMIGASIALFVAGVV